MNLHTVFFKFTSPLLLSNRGVDFTDISTTIASDTLKSALLVSALNINKQQEATEFLDAFTLSSTFFYTSVEGLENPICFFPKLFIKADIKVLGFDETDTKKNKKLKKVAYYDKEIFEQIVSGQTIEVKEDQFLFGGKVLVSASNKNVLGSAFTLYKTEEVQKVNLQDKEKPNPYSITRLHFINGDIGASKKYHTGLFFIIQYHNPQYKTIVEQAVRLLGEQGIGSYKTLGYGCFEPNFQYTLQIADVKDANAISNLSL